MVSTSRIVVLLASVIGAAAATQDSVRVDHVSYLRVALTKTPDAITIDELIEKMGRLHLAWSYEDVDAAGIARIRPLSELRPRHEREMMHAHLVQDAVTGKCYVAFFDDGAIAASEDVEIKCP